MASTSSAECAPTSMKRFASSIGFFLSASSITCGGFIPRTPGMSPFSPWRITRCETKTGLYHPPTPTNLMKPFSSMYWTIKPISSMCAASMILKSSPFFTAIRFPIRSVLISSTYGAISSRMILATAPSAPEIPFALESFSSNALISFSSILFNHLLNSLQRFFDIFL